MFHLQQPELDGGGFLSGEDEGIHRRDGDLVPEAAEAEQETGVGSLSCVFPFIKTVGEGRDTAFSKYMKDAVFLIPTPKVLAKVVDDIDSMDMNNKDIMGDVYEYLLSRIAAAGENSQFRTPRHIINMMVELMKPNLKDRILEIPLPKLIQNQAA